MQNLIIVLQVSLAKKPKYVREMLNQMHILDLNVADPILWQTYIANILINIYSLLFMFYKMDLFLEYQNSEFKQFWLDCGFFL